jgi:hypothetical protein
VVADAEGITGLISEVTVRVQPQEDLQVVAVGCAIASPTPQSNNNRTPPARRPALMLTRFRNTAGPA